MQAHFNERYDKFSQPDCSVLSSNTSDLEDRISDLYSRSPARKRVAVIGAGTSGLIVATKLLDKGLLPIVFEKSNLIGGVWCMGPHPAQYCGLVMNTSPKLTVYKNSEIPDPDCGLHYSRDAYCRYINNYFRNKGCHKYVVHGATVTEVRKQTETEWALRWHATLNPTNSREIIFSDVVYAAGLCHEPSMQIHPKLSNYDGILLHSSQFDIQRTCGFKKSLVIGSGNTAADIAVMLFNSGSCVHISEQTDTWYLPKVSSNLPIDELVGELKKDEGLNYKSALPKILGKSAIFSGKKNCDSIDFTRHRITVNELLPDLLYSNSIQLKPPISEANDSEISFKDGTSEHYDALICCTGFSVNLINSQNTLVQDGLGGITSKKLSGLWFVGSPAVWGGSPSLAEYQAELIATAIERNVSRQRIHSMLEIIGEYEVAQRRLSLGLEIIDYHDYLKFYQEAINTLARAS